MSDNFRETIIAELEARVAELEGFITEYQKRELGFQDRIAELEAIVNGVYDLDLLIPENPDESAMIRMDDFVALHKAAIKGDS